ncbi:MAG: S-layer homology domain-containing protein [Intestinimonas sp.]
MSWSELPGEGLEGKDPAVTYMPIVDREATFGHHRCERPQKPARHRVLGFPRVISGKSDGNFDPDGDMTRAEFAAIVVKALGLTPAAADRFTDVPRGRVVRGICGHGPARTAS